jgi:hypothetical protein
MKTTVEEAIVVEVEVVVAGDVVEVVEEAGEVVVVAVAGLITTADAVVVDLTATLTTSTNLIVDDTHPRAIPCLTRLELLRRQHRKMELPLCSPRVIPKQHPCRQ